MTGLGVQARWWHAGRHTQLALRLHCAQRALACVWTCFSSCLPLYLSPSPVACIAVCMSACTIFLPSSAGRLSGGILLLPSYSSNSGDTAHTHRLLHTFRVTWRMAGVNNTLVEEPVLLLPFSPSPLPVQRRHNLQLHAPHAFHHCEKALPWLPILPPLPGQACAVRLWAGRHLPVFPSQGTGPSPA